MKQVKNIVAINASHRRNGYTEFLLNKIKEGIQQENGTLDIIHLSEKKIHHCISCGTCHTQKSFLKCVFEEKDDVKDIFTRIRIADFVIYATPIYIFTISGLLKVLFDRFYSTMNVMDFSLTKSGHL